MRLIVLGIPHTVTSDQFNACAFTAKVVKFLEMMQALGGYEIIHLGHKDSVVPAGVTNIAVTNADIHRVAYGDAYVAEHAWRTTGFTQFDINDYAYREFHTNAIRVLGEIKQPNDIVCHTFGYGHKAIADAHPDLINIETGIGYPAAFARWRIYESHAIRNAMSGPESISRCDQNSYYRVIPNYFRAEDFVYSADKEDYLLYLGRLGRNKGLDIAIDVAKHTGRRLIIAGQGDINQFGPLSANIEYRGYADIAQRQHLLARAQALFIASQYMEPFAGVQVEAFLSGTPVISPDYAAFVEYNIHNQTGIRCNTFGDYVRATEQVQDLDPKTIREHGEQFLLDRIAPRFDHYFRDVMAVYQDKGWYTLR
jgi:glycosyltransferase involved in cell wall biosynthesis